MANQNTNKYFVCLLDHIISGEINDKESLHGFMLYDLKLSKKRAFELSNALAENIVLRNCQTCGWIFMPN